MFLAILAYLSLGSVSSSYILFLGAVDFLEVTARTLDKCVDQFRGLELEAYSGDYAL